MQKKNLLLGLGAAVVAFSTLFGVVACDDDEDDGTGATDEPTADDTQPTDSGDAAEPTATEAA
ncbi:MAG: hypothetical protein WEE64_15045 [Dehalococcoidia bacterium]